MAVKCSGEFVGRLFDQADGDGVALFGFLIDDGRQCGDPGTGQRKVRRPVLEFVHRIAGIEGEMAEHCVCKAGARPATIKALADPVERKPPDPVAAAFVSNHLAPPADTMGTALGVTGPGHRAGTGEKKDTSPAREGAEVGGIDIVEDNLRQIPENIGDDLLLKPWMSLPPRHRREVPRPRPRAPVLRRRRRAGSAAPRPSRDCPSD